MSNHQSSGSRGKAIATPPPPADVNCPRCDSPDTKFCYYNNYSLSQPRHFCKACKRYWTKGGALRNVPIGGGCRKNKKATKSSSGDSKDLDTGRFKYYEGMDFQVGGLTKFPSFNNLLTTPTVGNQLVSSFGNMSTVPIASSAISNLGLDPNSGTSLSQFMAFNNFPLSYPSSILKQDQGENNIGSFSEGLVPAGMGTTNGNGNLASPMESLSSINQDLHWKLQQERIGLMLNGGGNDIYQQQNGIIGTSTSHLESLTQAQKPQPMLFQNLEISSEAAGDSRKEINGIVNAAPTANLPTEWHFGNSSYAAAVNQVPSSNGNGKGIQGWANFDQYTSLP